MRCPNRTTQPACTFARLPGASATSVPSGRTMTVPLVEPRSTTHSQFPATILPERQVDAGDRTARVVDRDEVGEARLVVGCPPDQPVALDLEARAVVEHEHEPGSVTRAGGSCRRSRACSSSGRPASAGRISGSTRPSGRCVDRAPMRGSRGTRRGEVARIEIASVGGAPITGPRATGLGIPETSRLGTSMSWSFRGNAGDATLAGRRPGGPVMTSTGSTAERHRDRRSRAPARTSPGAVEMIGPTLVGAAGGVAADPGSRPDQAEHRQGAQGPRDGGCGPGTFDAGRPDRAGAQDRVRAALSCQPRRAVELSQAPDATTTHAPTSATRAPGELDQDAHGDRDIPAGRCVCHPIVRMPTVALPTVTPGPGLQEPA